VPCSPAAYLIAAHSDRVYASPSSELSLHQPQPLLHSKPALAQLGLAQHPLSSNPDLLAKERADPAAGLAWHTTSQEIASQALWKVVTGKRKVSEAIRQEVLTGQEAVQAGAVDGLRSFPEVMGAEFAGCRLVEFGYERHLKYLKKALRLFLDPYFKLIMGLLALKVLIKYGLILYMWQKARNQK
jgi:hypothetical protein